MKRKNKLLFGFSTVSTLAAIAYLQMAPMSTARAQTTDPGLEPDPVPRVEATPTATPCPGSHEEKDWHSRAVFHKLTCIEGGRGADFTPGSYTLWKRDSCNGDKNLGEKTSSWVVRYSENRPVKLSDGSTEVEVWYYCEEVCEDGKIMTSKWETPTNCCG